MPFSGFRYGLTSGALISLSDFIKEHKKLIPILKSGSSKQRKKEAQDQLSELKQVIKNSKRK